MHKNILTWSLGKVKDTVNNILLPAKEKKKYHHHYHRSSQAVDSLQLSCPS